MLDSTPVILLSGSSPTFTTSWNINDGPAALSDPITSSLTDNESTTLLSMTIALPSPAAGDLLTASAAGGITVTPYTVSSSPLPVPLPGYGGTAGMLVLSGASPLTNYLAALNTVQYTSTASLPAGTWKYISVFADDGVALSNVATHYMKACNTFLIEPDGKPNDQYLIAWSNQTGPVPVATSSALIVDDESPTLNSMTLSVANFTGTPPGTLAASSMGNITVTHTRAQSGGYTFDTLVLGGVDTLADYIQALRSVTYDSGSSGDGLSVAANDGVQSTTTTLEIAILSSPSLQNAVFLALDSPGVDYSTTWTQSGPVPIASDNAILIGNPNAQIVGMSVSGGSGDPGDALSVTPYGSIRVAANSSAGYLSLTGTDTLADYLRVLKSIRYDNTLDVPYASTAYFNVYVSYNPNSIGVPYTTHALCTIALPPTAYIGNATGLPSVSGDNSGTATFTISLSRPSAFPAIVQYVTSDGTAVADTNYVGTSGTVTFSPGQTSQTVSVHLVGSTGDSTGTLAPDTTFSVSLSAISNVYVNAPGSPTNTWRDSSPGAPASPIGIGTILGRTLTNRLPETLTEFPLRTVGDAAQLGLSVLTENTSEVLPLIKGPLADEAELDFESATATGSSLVMFQTAVPASGSSWQGSVAFGGPPPYSAGGYVTISPGGAPLTVMCQYSNYPPPYVLPTGTYVWTVTLRNYVDGTTYIFHGLQSIVNRWASPYGQGEWISGLDQLFIQGGPYVPQYMVGYPQIPPNPQPSGITYVLGDGTPIFFAYDGATGQYITPPGYFLTLTTNGAGYTIKTPQGEVKQFSSTGQLTSTTDPNGNVTSYEYNDDHTLHGVFDSSGHAVSFNYTNRVLASVTDAASRATTLQYAAYAYNAWLLSTITSPAPGPGLAPLQESLGQLTTGDTVGVNIPGAVRIGGQWVYFIGDGDSVDFVGDTSQLTATGVTLTVARQGAAETEYVSIQGLVTSVADGEGQTTKYDYYPNGLLRAITLPGRTQPQYSYTYDDQGNMLTRKSAGVDGLPDAVEHWTYDPKWNVPSQYESPMGFVTKYSIDQSNGNVRMIDQQVDDNPADDLKTYYDYTPLGGAVPAGLLASEKDPNGNTTTYDYQVSGSGSSKTLTVTITTTASDRSASSSRTDIYDFNTMDLLQSIDMRGKSTFYQYDNIDELTNVTEPTDSSGQSPGWVYGYTKGLLTSVKDPNQNLTNYANDFGSAFVVTETLPAVRPGSQRQVSWAYSDEGLLSIQTLAGALTETTRYSYNTDGELSDLYGSSDSRHTKYDYNDLGFLEDAVDPNGNASADPVDHTTTYNYDDRGQLISELDPPDASGHVPETDYKYDNDGRLVKVTDPLGEATIYGYDDAGRLTSETEPNGEVISYQYDGDGNLRFKTVSASGETPQVTEYQYDYLNRRTKVIDPPPAPGQNSPTTTYVYTQTADVNQVTETDPNGNQIVSKYDNLGRLIQELDYDIPSGGGWDLVANHRYAYDLNGNLVKYTDSQGRITTYGYDALNEKTSETWYASAAAYSAGTSDGSLSWSYDLAGNLTGASDTLSGASYVLGYNDLNEQTSATTNLPNLPTVTLSTPDSEFDPNGNRLQLSAAIGTRADFVNAYAYDDMNNLTSISQTGVAGGNAVATKQVGFNYNDDGQLTAINRYNALVPHPNNAALAPTGTLVAASSYGYDPFGRLTSINATLGNGNFINQSWGYDTLNRVANYTNQWEGTTSYGYDNDNRLISAANTIVGPQSFNYDANGNRTNTDGTSSTVISGNRLQSDGRYSYAYDTEGNLTSRTDSQTGVVLSFSYDNRDRLTEVSSSTGKFDVKYQYDAFDRRVSTETTTTADGGEGGTSTTTTTVEDYIYDGLSNDVVLDFLSTSNSSTPSTSFSLEHRYLWGPQTSAAAVDQVLAQENVSSTSSPGAVQWLLADNEGTIRDIVDNSGQPVQHYKYDAYGQLLSGNTSLTRYLYAGMELDPTTGLEYAARRWYDPHTGRFLTEDPAKQGTNFYEYADDSPTNETDPTGLAPAGKAARSLAHGLERLGIRSFFEIHHIIGRSIFSNPEYAAALAKLGVNPDSAKNLIALPNNVISRVLSGRSLHTGRHLDDYVEAARTRIGKVLSGYASGAIGDDEARTLIGNIQNELRQGLANGTIALQKADAQALASGKAIGVLGLFAIASPESVDWEAAKDDAARLTASYYLGEDSWTGWFIDLVNPLTLSQDTLTFIELVGLNKSRPPKGTYDGPAMGGELGSW